MENKSKYRMALEKLGILLKEKAEKTEKKEAYLNERYNLELKFENELELIGKELTKKEIEAIYINSLYRQFKDICREFDVRGLFETK